MPKPVVIVGAGLAGLTLARELHRAGIYYLVVDAGHQPGGRVRTDVVDGFKLDRGFQVYLPAYPIASRALDHESLELGAFAQGALIFDGQSTRTFARPNGFLAKLKTPAMSGFSISDLRHFAAWCSHLDSTSVVQLSRLKDEPGIETLRGAGLSDEFIDRFCRPFFGGVFLDRSLQVSSRQLSFVAKMFAEGDGALPAGGMQAIPNQIADDLPKYLFRWGSRVAEIETRKGAAVGVRLDTNESIEAEAVVVATEAREAAKLSGARIDAGSKASTCLYFETPYEFSDSGLLALNGSERGIVNHAAALTAAQPAYAPVGRHLASVTILGNPAEGDDRLAEIAKSEIEEWLPGKGVNLWRFIRAYRIEQAQLEQAPGWQASRPAYRSDIRNLFFAGEFTTNSSIDGAIESGLACAQAILSTRSAEAVA